MTAVAIVLAVLFTALLIIFWSNRYGVLTTRTRKNVIVTLKTEHTFRGILYSADSQVLILRNAQGIGVGPDAANVPVDGELMLFRSDVAFVQLP